jgi:selenocysteine lyase/cysteine desulfurase
VQVPSVNWNTPVQTILDHVTPKTRAIAVSWVQFQTGSVTDLKKLSQELNGRGIWLVADVIQGVGVRPFNFRESGFDAVCGGSHKWLCSAFGAAYMAVKHERLQELSPLEVGAMTYGTPDTPKSMSSAPRADASRFEPGTKSMAEIIALGSTLDLFGETGIDNIFNEASRIAGLLQSGLSGMGYSTISNGPILNFAPQHESDLDGIMKKLKAGQVSFARRGPGIRLSAHAYNTEDDVKKVLSLLKQEKNFSI